MKVLLWDNVTDFVGVYDIVVIFAIEALPKARIQSLFCSFFPQLTNGIYISNISLLLNGHIGIAWVTYFANNLRDILSDVNRKIIFLYKPYYLTIYFSATRNRRRHKVWISVLYFPKSLNIIIQKQQILSLSLVFVKISISHDTTILLTTA